MDEISDEAVIDAATRAQLKEFVDTLTEGFNTVVGCRPKWWIIRRSATANWNRTCALL